jgi:flagellar basal body-associated protein FliL
MSDKLYCTYCGALNEAGAIFCERCGHELEPIDVPAKDTKPAAEQDDLLTVLMEEPVTQIPDEPAAPVKKAAAAADTGRADADVLNENTQLFSRTELNAAIAASEAQKGTAAAQKEAELARQKERLIEESIRYYEEEQRDRKQQREARMRRQQEDALYTEFEKPADNRYSRDMYEEAPKKKKLWIPILVIVLLALAAGGFFGWKFFFDKTTVDLTRNISSQDIYLEGDNEEASVIIDDETLRARADYPRGNKKAEQFMQTVSYTAEPATGLSNGDTVVIRAIYSEETAKSLHINVKGEEKKFEVSGLEEKATINWDPLGLFDGKDKTDDTAQPADTLIPEIDTRYYTDKDVQGKSKDDVQAMLNELYARHGYIFQDATLKSQYEKQSWYKGTESDMSKVEQSFNTYEKKNLEYLTEVRSKL